MLYNKSMSKTVISTFNVANQWVSFILELKYQKNIVQIFLIQKILLYTTCLQILKN